jgi:hypothetical protein
VQFDWLWGALVVLAVLGLAIYFTLRAILAELKQTTARSNGNLDFGRSYALIDQAIRDWCASRGLKLSNSFAGREARFCYTSSPAGECFQIWIDPPTNTQVTVNAASVETGDDAELRASWTMQTSELVAALDMALGEIGRWKDRERTSA